MTEKLFGREPAVWIGLMGACFTLVGGMNLPWLSAGQAAAVLAALTALLIAVTTRPIAPALFTAAVLPIAAAFAEYGLHMSDQAVSGITALLVAVFALFGIRPQVSPEHEVPRR